MADFVNASHCTSSYRTRTVVVPLVEKALFCAMRLDLTQHTHTHTHSKAKKLLRESEENPLFLHTGRTDRSSPLIFFCRSNLHVQLREAGLLLPLCLCPRPRGRHISPLSNQANVTFVRVYLFFLHRRRLHPLSCSCRILQS